MMQKKITAYVLVEHTDYVRLEKMVHADDNI